jgi:hypothetical protein
MSKPSGAAAMAALAGVSFWIGCQPIFIGFLAYSKFWLGEGQGTYEGGLGGFLLGTFLLGLFSTVPAAAIFIAILILGLLFRNMARERTVRLYVYSALLGLFSSFLFIGLMVSS